MYTHGTRILKIDFKAKAMVGATDDDYVFVTRLKYTFARAKALSNYKFQKKSKRGCNEIIFM